MALGGARSGLPQLRSSFTAMQMHPLPEQSMERNTFTLMEIGRVVFWYVNSKPKLLNILSTVEVSLSFIAMNNVAQS